MPKISIFLIIVAYAFSLSNILKKSKARGRVKTSSKETEYSKKLKENKEREIKFSSESAKRNREIIKSISKNPILTNKKLQKEPRSPEYNSAFQELKDILSHGVDSNREMAHDFVKNLFEKKENSNVKKFDNKEYLRKAQEEKNQIKAYYDQLEKKEEAYRMEIKKASDDVEVSGKDSEKTDSREFDLHFLDSDLANAVIIKEILDKPLSLR